MRITVNWLSLEISSSDILSFFLRHYIIISALDVCSDVMLLYIASYNTKYTRSS